MAQTPRQRKANEKYAKTEAAKHGKRAAPSKPKQSFKSPLSTGWVVLLTFIICGGLAFELLRVVPELWGFVAGLVKRVTG